MRIFYKYYLTESKGSVSSSIEPSFESHSNAMDGYKATLGYQNTFNCKRLLHKRIKVD